MDDELRRSYNALFTLFCFLVKHMGRYDEESESYLIKIKSMDLAEFSTDMINEKFYLERLDSFDRDEMYFRLRKRDLESE